MEGEEDFYLKDNFLAHEAPLEAHCKQKECALLFFPQAKILPWSISTERTIHFCERLFSEVQLLSRN